MDARAPAAAGDPALQETPAREDWQTEWFSVLPEIDELARRADGSLPYVLEAASTAC